MISLTNTTPTSPISGFFFTSLDCWNVYYNERRRTANRTQSVLSKIQSLVIQRAFNSHCHFQTIKAKYQLSCIVDYFKVLYYKFWSIHCQGNALLHDMRVNHLESSKNIVFFVNNAVKSSSTLLMIFVLSRYFQISVWRNDVIIVKELRH